MRGTWVLRNGRMVEKGGPLDVRLQHQRSDLPCPMLIGDTMDAAEHVDGKFYSSKSAYRRVTRENGLVEVGNDTSRFKKPKAPDSDKGINDSIDRALARI